MRTLILIALLSISFAQFISDSQYIGVNDEHINYINSVQRSWTAGKNKLFEGKSRQFIKSLMGTFTETPAHLRLPLKVHEINEALPENFDSREAWPKCESIKEVRDQANCGSCWAFGAAEAMSDRICIASNQTLQTRISTENLVSCCGFLTCGMGCNGGWPSGAWKYWVKTGLVTGDLYNVSDWCQPYSLAPCDHHVNGTLQPCSGSASTPKCKKTCRDGYQPSYSSDLHFGESSYSISSNEDQIKTEIMKHGPVEAAFTVYSDFPNYKSGVYHYTSGSQLGGHAIKIIGWGVENGENHWIVVNSWNEDWGDRGTFKIRRGTNECGIEGGVVAGIPKL